MKINKIYIFVFTIFSLSFFLSPSSAHAAKTRVWGTKKTATVATRPSFSVKFRSDRRALNVNFYNINLAQSISYELTYLGNDIDQGVVGAVRPSEGNSAFRLLLFGTCSKNVCTYHRNIQNARLVITAKLNNGKTLIKRYTIRV